MHPDWLFHYSIKTLSWDYIQTHIYILHQTSHGHCFTDWSSIIMNSFAFYVNLFMMAKFDSMRKGNEGGKSRDTVPLSSRCPMCPSQHQQRYMGWLGRITGRRKKWGGGILFGFWHYVQTRPDQPHNHNMLGEGGGGFRSRFTLYHASIVLATCTLYSMLAAKG